MTISNEIFETYRTQERVKEQTKAIKLLLRQGYTILDLEGNILRKQDAKKWDNIEVIKGEIHQRKKKIWKW